MKKRYKLLFSIASLMFAFCALVTGVFALTQATYTVKGSMSYSLEYGLLEITTSVYKYVGTPIAQEKGEEYFENLEALEPLSEYDSYYCTYDENYLLKDTVENQLLDGLDFDYKQGQAYFIVVHATSQTKDKGIRVKVETTFNVENSWFVTTGSTVLTKNKTGKDIIFAWGIENSALSSNGDFNFNITFEEDTEYVPQDTGSVNIKVADKSTTEEAYVENYTEQFTDFNEAEYYEKTLSVSMTTDQMEVLAEDGATSYFPIINLESGGYGIDTTITYRLKNVRLYDQNGDSITTNQGDIMYLVFNGKNFVGFEDLMSYVQNSGAMPTVSEVPPEFTIKLNAGESQKDCILVGFFVEDTATIIPTTLTFDLDIIVQERMPFVVPTLPYDYRYQIIGVEGGLAYVAPGKLKSKNQNMYNVEATGFDVVECEDYVYDFEITMSDMEEYIAKMGVVEISATQKNPALYGNPLVFMQVYLAYTFGSNSGYLPIVKQKTTINGYLYEPENWVGDYIQLSSYMDSLSDSEKEQFSAQNLIPIPQSEDGVLSLPVHVFKVENVLGYFPVAMFLTIALDNNFEYILFDYMLYFYYSTYQINVQKGVISNSCPTFKQFIIAMMGGQLDMPNVELSEYNNYYVDLEFVSFVDGSEISYSALNQEIVFGYASDYYDYTTVNYKSEQNALIFGLDCEKYQSTSSQLTVVGDCLYTSDLTSFFRYPNLKAGSNYIVQDGTTGVVDYAFAHNQYLTNVTIPKTVTTFGEGVFYNSSVGVVNVYQETLSAARTNLMSSLKNSNVEKLNIYATTYMTESEINTLEMDCGGIFVNVIYLDNLSGLSFEEKADGMYVTSVPDSTVTQIIVPQVATIGDTTMNVVGINDSVFANCSNLTELSLPNTLISIGNNNFAGCTALTKIYLNDANITTFGTGNTRADLEIYTKSQVTLATIKATDNKVISVDWQILIDRYYNNSTGYGDPSTLSDYFNYNLTIGDKTYNVSSSYNKTVRAAFDNIMIIFPETAGTLNVSLTAQISTSSDSNKFIDAIQEQISLSKKESNGSYTKIMGTATDETYANHSNVNSVSVSYPVSGATATVNTGDELRLRIYFTIMEQAKCFTAGTMVTMADGSYQKIENITYDDLLMVYDFDRGEFGVSYPAWMATPATYGYYYLMEFDDGSTLEVVLSHRLFTDDDLDYEKSIDADYSSIGKKFVRQIMVNGLPRLTTVTCTNITRVEKEVTYYNIVTSQALNFFSNGFIGATGIANMYTFDKIDDQTYVHNQTQLNYTKSGTTDDETGTMFAYERFNSEKIPYYIYVAYRLGEIRNMVNVLSKVPPYNQYPLAFVESYAIGLVNDYFKDDYMEDIAQMPDTFKVTLSDREQNTRYNEKDLYTLPTPINAANFVGWYNTFDGKIYQPGESAEIYMNTHFIARYAA